MAGTLVRGTAGCHKGQAWRALACQIAAPEAKRVDDLHIGGYFARRGLAGQVESGWRKLDLPLLQMGECDDERTSERNLDF
jgi:hypothetical protein